MGTPIGNLEDMTFRAARVLREVDRVACEDTRVTRVLCDHLGVDTPLIRHDAHNQRKSTPGILALLDRGLSVALVTDAGTPGISDPGAHLVAEAVAAGREVVPVPGPSAVVTALSASGLPSQVFQFHGFAPKKARERRRAFGALGPGTHALYCPARDLPAVVGDLAASAPGARVVVARELTKQHEAWLRGPAPEVAAQLAQGLPPRGEAVLLVRVSSPQAEPQDDAIAAALKAPLAAGKGTRQAAAEVAQALGVSRRRAYQVALHLPSEPE